MASKANEPQIYTIPPNFARQGTLMGGLIKTRNLIEAVIFDIPILYFLSLIPMDIKFKIILMVFIAGPIAILSIVGLNDSPISIFLFDFFKHILSSKHIKYYSFGVNNEINNN